MPQIAIRPATLNDIPEILRQRRRMYEDMHYQDASAIAEMSKLTEQYLVQSLTKTFHSWLACIQNSDHDRSVAGGAVIINPWPAHPYDLECRRATILNVYTDPEFRRQGIARQLMQTMIAWCREQGLARVTLHASDDGRHLYESLGFEASNEMRLRLR